MVVFGGGAIGPGWGNGKAAAVLYAREGARVVVVDNRPGASDETVEIIRSEHGEAFGATADATRNDDVRRVFVECADKYGRIDILHNNVGGQGTGRSLDDVSIDDWNETLARNLTSSMLTCRAALPYMRRVGGGAIVNVSSIASVRYMGVPSMVYSAAKAALNQMTSNIAIEYASENVRANCVLPGYIDTPFMDRVVGGRRIHEIKGYDSSEAYSAARARLVPLGRMGTAWDVANAALFLASDDASYITGTALLVDGGVTGMCPGV